jgi:cation diffusion facilitator CzcD-associated flavoprotein CzcO
MSASQEDCVNDGVDVAIVGAGPYGLSIGAHLHAFRREFRIFGNPMQTWRERMPDGMQLNSDGFASNLSDPQRQLTHAR